MHTASLQGDVEIARLSRGPTGAESDAPSDRPAMNFDGSRVAFDSAAQNLAPGSGGEVKVYQRDNPLAAPVRSATFWKSNEKVRDGGLAERQPRVCTVRAERVRVLSTT